jgi:Mg2+/Co2+ transporter CorB
LDWFAEFFSLSTSARNHCARKPAMTNVGVVIDFVFGVALIAASAAFSAVDTAIFSMSPDRRRLLKTADPRSAAMLERLMERPSDVANALLVANTITNLPLLVLVLHLAGQPIASPGGGCFSSAFSW